MNDFLGRIESGKGPVECLGQTFPNHDARREHFLNPGAAGGRSVARSNNTCSERGDH